MAEPGGTFSDQMKLNTQVHLDFGCDSPEKLRNDHEVTDFTARSHLILKKDNRTKVVGQEV